MNKVFAICFCVLIVLLAGTIGCSRDISPGLDVENATKVTIDELRDATQNASYFQWTGSDDKFHYFRTKEGYYRMTIEHELPHRWDEINRGKTIGNFGVPVVVKDGKIIHSPR